TALGEISGATKTATSTASGAFRLAGLDTTETYAVWANADSFTTSDTLRGVHPGTQDLAFKLIPQDGQIAGWVRELGTAYPLSGAVLVADDGHGHYASANSDSAGFFLLKSLARLYPYTLTVTKFGYKDTTVSNLKPDTTLTVLLTPLTGKIHGWVKLRDGSPLGAVPVYARSTTIAARVESTKTSDQGEFTFESLVVDRYLVYPLKAGYVSKPAQETVTLNPNATVELSFQMKEAVLAALVLDGPSEIPNDQPTAYSYTALTDSGESIILAQVHWQLVPSLAGAAVSGKVYPNPDFFGPASVIVADPVTGIADTLAVLIYGRSSSSDET
ncbi:MAG TPA: carboxypeptidase regulatory-like domain-containing protein, partial [Bacteroidetes bacterium]|nr:carboxypeptidase regulatory-like domain-containing protein [Bacteroidota bacterium]